MRTALLLATLAIPAAAHELQENRATLALRAEGVLSVTLYINYCEALYQALASQRPYAAFLVIYSGMRQEDLQKELSRAQAKFQSGARIQLAAAGADAPLTHWVWPDVSQVQALLRRQLMQAMADPANHAHAAPSEIRAEAKLSRAATSVFLRLPAEFQKVLVVSYKPNQTWADPKSGPTEIKF